jgi:hypothetical protein
MRHDSDRLLLFPACLDFSTRRSCQCQNRQRVRKSCKISFIRNHRFWTEHLKLFLFSYTFKVIFRLGRVPAGGAKGPGLFFVLPCIDKFIKVDLRTITFEVPPQEILTKDSVTVTVDAVCYFRTFNPVVSVTNVENAQFSTRLLAATSLRNILGTRTLQEILQDKESIAHHMQVLNRSKT